MSTSHGRRRPRILFVDDETNVLRAIERCLRDEGYELFFTNDPLRVPDIVRKERIDVIVTDELMPAKKGTVLLRELEPHHCAHLIMTGIIDETPVLAGVSAGIVDDYLLKPFAATKLRNFIRAAIPPWVSKPAGDPARGPDGSRAAATREDTSK